MNDISEETVPTDKPRVFLQPYKLIVTYETQLRQRLNNLGSKWANYHEVPSKGRDGRPKLQSKMPFVHLTVKLLLLGSLLLIENEIQVTA